MPTPIPSSVALVSARDADPFAQAQMAAAAYLARYSGRTLETYRYDLRTFFQWCTDLGLDVLEATRPHIELWRSAMEERGLAASTIDRRLSTICGFYRFAHIDGRIPRTPRNTPAGPRCTRAKDVVSTGASWPVPLHGRALRPRPRRPGCFVGPQWPPGERGLCDRRRGPGLRPGPSHAAHHREGQQAGHDSPGPQSGPDDRPRSRRAMRRTDPASPRWSATRPAHRTPLGPLHRQASRPRDCPPHMLRAAFIMAALDAGVPLRDVQIAARHADPRTTTIYDRRRENFDRHAAYVVVAFVAGG